MPSAKPQKAKMPVRVVTHKAKQRPAGRVKNLNTTINGIFEYTGGKSKKTN